VNRRDEGDLDLAVEQRQLAAEVAGKVEPVVARGKAVVHQRATEVERRHQLGARLLGNGDGVTDVVEVAMADEDEIGLVELGQILLAALVRWVRDPGIDEDRLAARRDQLEGGVTVKGELRRAGSVSARAAQRGDGDGDHCRDAHGRYHLLAATQAQY
jgi:hypothetical protein